MFVSILGHAVSYVGRARLHMPMFAQTKRHTPHRAKGRSIMQLGGPGCCFQCPPLKKGVT